jgi:hypothetical protein
VGTIAPRTRRRILAHERELLPNDGSAALAKYLRDRELAIAAGKAAAQEKAQEDGGALLSDSFISSSPMRMG